MLEASAAALLAQASAQRDMTDRLAFVFDRESVPRENSLYEKIENCAHRARIWAIIENRIDLHESGMPDGVPIISYFSLFIGALLTGVHCVRVNDRLLCMSKYRVLPGSMRTMTEPSEERYDGHRELNAPTVQPVQLIDVLHHVLMHIECDEALVHFVQQIDGNIAALAPLVAQQELCTFGRCKCTGGHCEAQPQLEVGEAILNGLVREMLAHGLLRQPWFNKAVSTIHGCGNIDGYVLEGVGGGNLALRKAEQPKERLRSSHQSDSRSSNHSTKRSRK